MVRPRGLDGLEVGHELELRWLLDGEPRRARAPDDPVPRSRPREGACPPDRGRATRARRGPCARATAMRPRPSSGLHRCLPAEPAGPPSGRACRLVRRSGDRPFWSSTRPSQVAVVLTFLSRKEEGHLADRSQSDSPVQGTTLGGSTIGSRRKWRGDVDNFAEKPR